MFWKRNGGDAPEERPEEVRERPTGPIRVERDAQRPATILRVAGEFEERGGRIVELFKEVRSSRGETAVIPIHVSMDDQQRFVEVSTRPWTPESVEAALHTAATVRASEHADVELDILSAYPVPEEIEYFFARSPGALFQLDLLHGSLDRPEEFAEIFREAARRHWDVEPVYETASLPLIEELLISVLEADERTGKLPPILDALGGGLGCYLGEVVRRQTSTPGSWRPAQGWGDGLVLEFDDVLLDPIGKAHAFLYEGPEDSLAFYADYVLEEIDDLPQMNAARDRPED
jgi:hypothetical protein